MDSKIDRRNADTHQKALAINLNPRLYGTFAEIGAGQEVVRWFFQVGGAAGTIAKSISAYDMTVSDAIYGPSPRYVSRERLQMMLDYEFELLLERLGPARGENTDFFVFCFLSRNFLSLAARVRVTLLRRQKRFATFSCTRMFVNKKSFHSCFLVFKTSLSLSLIQNRLLCPRTLSSCIGPQSAFGVSALRLAMVDDCCCYSCLSLYCIRIGNIVASRAAVASRSHRICGNKSAKRCVFAVNIKHSHSILAGFTRRRHVACAHVKSHGAQ